jgi:anti-sigma-K factor RskA
MPFGMSASDDIGAGEGGDQVLAGEFALGVLPAAEHAAVARRVAAEPALAAEVRFWRHRLSALDAEFAEEAAPAAVFPRIEQRLFPAAAGGGGIWNSLAFWRSVAGAAAAVAVVAVGFNLMQPRVDPQEFATQLVAALQAQEGSGVEFVALYDEASGRVRLTALSGEAIPEKDFELWYIKGSEPAVSMGVIPVDQKSEIVLPPEAREKFGEGIVLAVTLEQKGGSPTGVAQGPIVAVGSATPI